MERSRMVWVVPALALFGIGSAIYGYQEHQGRRASEMQAEAHYQQSFHDLSAQVGAIQDNLGTALASGSADRVRGSIHSAATHAEVAKMDVSHLPLGVTSMTETQRLTSDVSAFSGSVANGTTATSLTANDRANLQNLYRRTARLGDSLSGIQTQMINNQTSWVKAQSAMVAQSGGEYKGPHDNVIIDQRFLGNRAKTLAPSAKGQGPLISTAQAADIARRWMGEKSTAAVNVAQRATGSSGPVYEAKMRSLSGAPSILDISQSGGHVLQQITDRRPTVSRLDLVEAQSRATTFLSAKGFGGVTIVDRSEADDEAVLIFAPNANGVVELPRHITVTVALDNGEVVAFNATPYWTAPRLQSTTPRLTEAQARARTSPSLHIEETQLCVTDAGGTSRLAYEFLGTMDGETYRVLIDALNGRELAVEKLSHNSPSVP